MLSRRPMISLSKTPRIETSKQLTRAAILMTAQEMQRLTNIWINDVYLVNEHSALGMSPLKKITSWTVTAMRQIQNERSLDIPPAKPAKRMPTITRKGIRYDKADFFHPLLSLPEYCGKQAGTCTDPNSHGRIIIYGDRKFVSVVECAERTDIDRQEIVALGRALRKEVIAQKCNEFRALKKSTANEHSRAGQRHADHPCRQGRESANEKLTERWQQRFMTAIPRLWRIAHKPR